MKTAKHIILYTIQHLLLITLYMQRQFHNVNNMIVFFGVKTVNSKNVNISHVLQNKSI